jgi:gag-polypeptide of LTR copia-type
MPLSPDPLAHPAPGVAAGPPVAAHMAAAASSTKASLSVKGVKFDTILSHTTADVWFRRVRVIAETLDCAAALSDDSAAVGELALRQAKFILTVNLPDDQCYLLDTCATAKALWAHLQAEYAGKTFVRKAELIQRIVTEVPPQSETLLDYTSRLLRLRAECISGGVDDDVLFSATFLNAMKYTDQYRDWAVQKLQLDPVPTLPDLVPSLRTTFRNLLDEQLTSMQPSAHTTQRTTQECSYCHKQGHSILDCRKLRADQAARDERAPNDAAAANRSRGYGRGRGRGRGGGRGRGNAQAFLAVAFAGNVSKRDTWLADTCATHHMVNDRSYFQTFLPTTERCHFADSAVNVEVAGKGTVVLRTPSGALQPLKDVLYVPSFSVNLISLSKADSNGLLGRWGNGTISIEKPDGTVVLRAKLRDGLYHADCTAQRSKLVTPQPASQHAMAATALSGGRPLKKNFAV